MKNNNEAIERMRRASILASENFVKIGRRNISKPAYEYLLMVVKMGSKPVYPF